MPKSYLGAASSLRRPPGSVHSLIETLETRALLSVSLNADGWTVITPPAGAHVIYCSNSTGNDANDGLSPDRPVQTLPHAVGLLRDHSGDQLLLKRGDVWNSDLGVWRKSGKSADQPLVVGAYGTGDRPLLLTGTESGLDAISVSSQEIDNLAIMGIHFVADGRDPSSPTYVGASNSTGINFLTKSSNLLIEDCQIEGYVENINVQAFYGPIQNVQIRRNVIDNAYAINSHSQGLYAYGVTNLLVEGNVFDHNGYNDAVPGAEANWYNHDCYLSGENQNCTVRDNIFAEASGYGLQARAGGDIEDNLFLNNPMDMSFGLVNGAHVYPGGVTGVVNGNVFVGGANIGTTSFGSGLELANTRPGYPTIVSNNIFTHSIDRAPFAIKLTFGLGESNAQDAAGLNDLTVEDNIVYDWYRGVWVDSGFQAGGKGLQAMNNVQIRQNDFQGIAGPVVTHQDPIIHSQERWSDNRYSSGGVQMLVANRSLSLKQWNADETGADVAQVDYTDAERSIEQYNQLVGGQSTVADFLAQAKLQSSQNWRPQYEAESVINYYRQGFQEVAAPPRDWRAPTPPIATASFPATVLDRDSSLTFSVTYTDRKQVIAGSIASGNVNLVGPRGLNVPATLVNVTGSGATMTATYSVAIPDLYFRKGAPRKLTVSMNPSQVSNSDGFTAVPGPIGTSKVRVLPRPKAPIVRNVALVNRGAAIAVRFSQAITGVTAADLVLQSETGQTLDPATMAVSWDAAHKTATWTFPGQPGGTVPAGAWHMRITAADIMDAGGWHLDGNGDGLGGDNYVAKKVIVVKEISAATRR